jgi:hypothetical protein
VGTVEIVNLPIYTEAETASGPGPLQFLRRTLNAIHFDTRAFVIRRELLFAEGDVLDPRLLAETERNLRGLGFLTNVHVAAVDTSDAGEVGVRVTVQETWTLETSLSFSIASGDDNRWNLSFSEDNFLGRGMNLGLGLGADENGSYWSVFLRERRLLGSRWRFQLSLTDRSDGYVRRLEIDRPFYSQRQPWGMDLIVDGSQQEERYYLSNAGPSGVDPSQSASLFGRFPYLREGVSLSVRHRLHDGDGSQLWRIGAGVSVRRQDYDLADPVVELSDGRFVDLSYLTEGDTPLTREQGVTVWPQLILTTETTRWGKTRFLLRYGVVEDIPVGTIARLRIGPAGPAVGSTSGTGERVKLRLELSDNRRLGRGFLLAFGELRATLGREADRNWRGTLAAGWIGNFGDPQRPWLPHVIAEAGRGDQLLGSEALVLGLARGLRTLSFDGQAGDRLYRWNLEQGKMMASDVLGFVNLGLAAFYAGGAAWFEGEDRDLGDALHEVGFGLRLGSTRSSRSERTRLDLTWALDGSAGPVFTAVTQGFF